MATVIDNDLQIPRHAATLRVAVEDRLRQAIISGRFKGGERLVEKSLCELFGVGRTSVREALRQLEAEGLIVNLPHRGPSVSVVGYEEAEQIYQVRSLLEGLLGQEFALTGSPDAIARLTRAVDAFEEAAAIGDSAGLVAAKTAFYQCLMDGGGNRIAVQMLTLTHNRITLLRMTSMQQAGRLTHSVREVRDILAAVQERNGPRAAAACRHHVDMASRAALGYLRTNPATSSGASGPVAASDPS